MAKTAESLVVPALGESVTEATVGQWLKQVGDSVEEDETLVELETDKVTMEVNAPKSGVLTEIKAQEGDTVEVGDVLGMVAEGKGATAAPKAKEEAKPVEVKAPEPKPQAAPAPAAPVATEQPLSPAVRRMVTEESLDPTKIPATGKGGRITKEDVVNFLSSGGAAAAAPAPAGQDNTMREKREPMSRLRQTVAKRLKDAQNTAAILTTFNEIDMTNVIELRTRLKESFEKKHGVKLGFMSFFVKAWFEALKDVPAVNAEIDGTDLIYKNFYDISVAIGAPQGLVVPVIRNADTKSFAQIEQDILDYAAKAREGKLAMADMTGGTFTISNGGVYGSLLSTPILNPPQSGILGMHKTEKRPVVIGDKIEVRPMMYVAFSYDHRIIDGKEAVTFLVRIKECIENPERILLNT